jgi:hypothetical protein
MHIVEIACHIRRVAIPLGICILVLKRKERVHSGPRICSKNYPSFFLYFVLCSRLLQVWQLVSFQQVVSEQGTMARGKARDGDGSSGAKEGGMVVQWIVIEVGGGTAFPVLTKTNYTDWAMLMHVKLKAHGLWVTIDKGGVDPQEDMMTLDALVSAVLSEMVATVADKRTVKEAWDAITTLRVSDDRV